MSDNPVKDEVENFNRRSLKKTETKVKTNLPTQEGECALNISFAQFHTSPSTIVSKHIFGYYGVIVKCTPRYLSTFHFSFVIKMQKKKGSDLIYEELMTFAPGTMIFQIRWTIKCVQGSFILKRRRGQFFTDFTICIKSDHASVSVFLL